MGVPRGLGADRPAPDLPALRPVGVAVFRPGGAAYVADHGGRAIGGPRPARRPQAGLEQSDPGGRGVRPGALVLARARPLWRDLQEHARLLVDACLALWFGAMAVARPADRIE